MLQRTSNVAVSVEDAAETEPRDQRGSAGGDVLDRIAAFCDRVRPWSAEAAVIAATAVILATALRFGSGLAGADLRFGIYVAAILASGLLGGVPAAIGTAVVSLVLAAWAFLPPYFSFKPLDRRDWISIAMAGLAALITVCFAYWCRTVLRRLSHRNVANEILAKELSHRGSNMLSATEVILRKSLLDNPDRATMIMGRVRAVHRANELLAGTKTGPITICALLRDEFAAYGENRFETRGPELRIEADTARHFLLLFHELATNAAKYGALSLATGKVIVDWRWNGSRRLFLRWTEVGGPKILPPSREGFGTQLIQTCTKALSGTMESNFARDGFHCSITVRLGK